jgi:protein tyrosine/serine phosphatase
MARAGQAAVALLVAVGGFFGLLQLGGNFHAVVPGALYRAAQVTPERLAVYARAHGVRTVINLRGAHPGEAWYDAELAAAAALGLGHVDFPMSAKRELEETQAAALIALMRAAPKPALIHCMGGADRSGLAAALYVAAVAGGTEAEAEAQLSPRFGHIPIPFLSSAYAMDRTFERLEPWLGIEGS